MKFDQSLRSLWQQDGPRWKAQMPEGWMQGRSVFGGLTTAMAAALARPHVSEDRPLRTLTVQLVRPTGAGEVEGHLEIIREGRSVSLAEVRLSQGGKPVAITHLTFARPRSGGLEVHAPDCPETPDPETLFSMPYLPGITPEFTQHVDMRWATGGIPYSGQTDRGFTGLIRYRVPAGDLEGVIGLLDAWPCPALSMLKTPAPASTVTWTAHVVALPERCDQWFTFTYETVVGRGGFHTVVGHLFDEQGQLLGWTEQLVVVFD